MLDLTRSWFGYLALAIFVLAYILVIFEETTQLRKSKPVLMAAGLIWALIGMAYAAAGMGDKAEAAAQHVIMEYGELFLFLLVAITYVNTLEERRVFEVLRVKLTSRNLSYRSLFWLTGIVAFFLSSVLDNLTTALVMGAVALAIGAKSPKFIVVSCISVVVAANAGGAFSPFGDITTLMVWQKDKLAFFEFFALSFHPSSTGWCLRRSCISPFRMTPPRPALKRVRAKPGAQWRDCSVRADHRHGGCLPEFPASAACPGHDAGPGLSAGLVLLPAAQGGAPRGTTTWC